MDPLNKGSYKSQKPLSASIIVSFEGRYTSFFYTRRINKQMVTSTQTELPDNGFTEPNPPLPVFSRWAASLV